MAERIINPIINKRLGELIRPTSEQARALFSGAMLNQQVIAAMVASLSALADDDVIDDGRESVGVTAPTVGTIRAAASLLDELVNNVKDDPRLAAVFSLCVRELTVS